MNGMASGEAVSDDSAVPMRARSTFEPPWVLLALAPVIMAAVTWGPQNYHYAVQIWLRFFSLPVLIIEAVVIGMAMARGVRLVAIFRGMPIPAQSALVVLIAIALGTAMFVAPDPASAILRTNATLIHICFGLSVAGLVAQMSVPFDRDIWVLIVAGLLLYVLLLIVYVAHIRDPAHFEWLHFGLAVSNIRFVGFFIIVGASASIALATLAGDRRHYWGWVLASTIFTTLMFWSGSRNPVVALFGTCMIAILLLPLVPRIRLVSAWICSMIGGALMSLVYVPPHWAYGIRRMIFSFASENATVIASGRPDLWKRSLQAVGQRPLFGYGEGQYILVVPKETGFHPHNLIFQFLVQWGVIGAVCALGLLAAAWWYSLRKTREYTADLLPSFFALNALLLMSLLDGIFFWLYPSMMVALTIGLLLGSALRPGYVITRP